MRTSWPLLALFAPPRCAACGAGCATEAQICGLCDASLVSTRVPMAPCPATLDSAWAAFPHEGVARELVVALKFRCLLPVGGLIAELIARRVPDGLLAGTLVPVPATASRLRRRGFDPAEEIARSLAAAAGLPYADCLARADGPRQVGRSRRARIAHAPRVGSARPAPFDALLVDDVMTTGATLSACARALRAAGAQRVVAVTFARTM